MAARRRAEAEDCAARLNVGLRWLGLPEGDWSASMLEEALRALLAKHQPQVVYAPSRFDFHPEHVAVATALARALEGVAVPVRIYGVQVPLGPVRANRVVDVTEVRDELAWALEAYASQRHNVARCWRPRRYAAAYHRAGQLAEELWELSAADYAALHPASQPQRRYHGLRAQPWSDPLAYLTGVP
jgi:LmbE family N-acetylglucosaminyl deacetylase